MSEPVTLASNAPPHWPAIRVAEWQREESPEARAANRRALAEALEAAGPEGEIVVEAEQAVQLFDEGFAQVPLTVRKDGERRDVWLYAADSEAAAGHWAALTRLYREAGHPEPLYFAAEPLSDAEALTTVLAPFDFQHFSLIDSRPPRGRYASWWVTEDQSDIRQAPAYRSLSRLYQALEGIRSYAVGWLYRSFAGEAYAEIGRVQLPSEPAVFPVTGPGDSVLLFEASAEKGLVLRFHQERTSVWQRDTILRLMAGEMETLRQLVQEHQLPLDGDDAADPSEYWARLELILSEQGEQLKELNVAEVE